MIDIEAKKQELELHLNNALDVYQELQKAHRDLSRDLYWIKKNVELTVPEIAKMCDCSPRTIHRHLNMPVQEGGLRSKKILDVLEYKQQKGK